MDNTGSANTAGQMQETQLWRSDILGGLELLRARHLEFSYSPHTHEEFMIAVTEDGVALPRYRGGTHLHNPGNILVLNPAEVHGGGPVSGELWSYRSFYVPAGLLQRAATELSGREQGLPQFNENVVSDSYVSARLYHAHMALDRPGSALEREVRLLEALGNLAARHAVNRPVPHPIGREHQAIQQAKEYLESLPAENVSLETLAHLSGVSPYHLCRIFRKETGLSPHSYQTLVRLRLAKSLLAEGVSIAQAAVEAGFYDQAHLTRHFKRVYGVTPGKYRSYP